MQQKEYKYSMTIETLNAEQLNARLSGNQACKFASFTYTNNYGETSQYLVLLNVDYRRCVEDDIAFLNQFIPRTELEAQAKQELLASFSAFLDGESKSTKKNYYKPVGKTVKIGENDCVYIVGMVLEKKVITPGEPRKPVNSNPLTVEKNKLRKLLKTSRYREFKVSAPYFVAKTNGETIEISTVQEVDITTNPNTVPNESKETVNVG